HTLTYVVPNPEGEAPYQDEDGNWVIPDPFVTREAPCRAQENVRANYTIADQDGNRVEFNYVVHLSKDSDTIVAGTDITVKKNDSVIYTGTVKRFHPGQLHNRLWV